MEKEYRKIFEARCALEDNRDSERARRMGGVRSLLRDLGMAPYSVSVNVLQLLLESGVLRDVAKGPKLEGGSFFYRITSVRSLLVDKGLKWQRRYFVAQEDYHPWSFLAGKCANSGWANLSDFAKGHLTGFRGFTWWTSSEFFEQGVLAAAHRVGLPNDWIPKYALVLRCSFPGQLLATPTCIDGFFSPIFEVASFDGGDVRGFALDISDRENLRRGAPEYVAGKVPSANVEFKAVMIDRNVRKANGVRLSEQLLQCLVDYYTGLCCEREERAC